MTIDPHAAVQLYRVGQLEALASPVRTRILRYAVAPITVAELAERIEVPQTRLYYHINQLVEEELLTQVDSRKSGARIERIYQRTGANYQLSPELALSVGDDRKAAELAASLMLEPARVEIEDSIERLFRGEEPAGSFSRTVVRLSEEDFREFKERFRDLVSDFSANRSDDGDGRSVALTVALVALEEG